MNILGRFALHTCVGESARLHARYRTLEAALRGVEGQAVRWPSGPPAFDFDRYRIIDLETGEVVQDGDPVELIQERCAHPEASRRSVGPPRDLGAGVMVSGALEAPFDYCDECGKRFPWSGYEGAEAGGEPELPG